MSGPTHSGRPIAEARLTSLGLYVTAKEAYSMWQADPGRVTILDVRPPEEWVFVGHAPMAVNVPVAFMAYVWDEEKHGYPWEREEPTTSHASTAPTPRCSRCRGNSPTCCTPPHPDPTHPTRPCRRDAAHVVHPWSCRE